MHSGVLFGLTVLLGHICVCSGVKCYACFYTTVKAELANSVADCDEGANFYAKNLTDHKKTTDCTGKCFKSRLTSTDGTTVTRGCYESCPSSAGADGQGLFCCSTDFCNDSWRMKASLTGAVASVLAALLLLKA